MSTPMIRARERMQKAGVFSNNQLMGRLQSIGCVAVEITQKCNLDCSLCYLSEHSQSVRDIPIEEVFRRLDSVVKHYGQGTHVQITGGDPTLRKHTELVEIVAYARRIGLYPALFTNGIAASRELLSRLSDVGLCDVAFHVDTTQKRNGYVTEAELNSLREEYIERTKGLGLMVVFNTTVHRGNFEQIPELVKFMLNHADRVSFASFQLQAETGRGEWGPRDIVVTQDSVRAQLERGVERSLPWGRIQLGHVHCHSYMPTLVANKRVLPVVDDQAFFEGLLKYYGDIKWDRHKGVPRLALRFTKVTLMSPGVWPLLAKASVYYLKQATFILLRARGRVHKLSFFIQNFMDAKALEPERVDACSFMVMTADGPVSMCEHNARRDDYILKPLTVRKRDGEVLHYQPLKKGATENNDSEHATADHYRRIPSIEVDSF